MNGKKLSICFVLLFFLGVSILKISFAISTSSDHCQEFAHIHRPDLQIEISSYQNILTESGGSTKGCHSSYELTAIENRVKAEFKINYTVTPVFEIHYTERNTSPNPFIELLKRPPKIV